jgi:pimeloyl-ACP methyl ester carboxylesterase
MKTLRLAIACTVMAAIVALSLMAAHGQKPLVLAQDSYFFVGGQYIKAPDGDIMVGQMYVRALIPASVTKPYPIVMIHGFGQSGANFEGTPDGREGWAQYFVRAGYKVYVVDQPARGRSAYHPDQNGPTPRINAINILGVALGNAHGIAQVFTAPEIFNQYPQAHFHTQWPGAGPGKGQPGDPIFDQFFASQLESIPTGSELLVKAAGAALLDKIGPSILLTHSQSGAFGWQIADARHALVKAVLAIEPGLSPIVVADGAMGPPYGITMTTITYADAVSDPSQLARNPQTSPDSPELSSCWIQGESVRQLPTLQGIPIAIVIGQASYFARTSHCISKYLTQAGVANDLIRLENVGIFGNGHMMMLEKNSDDIARFLANWLQRRKL